jgi:cyclopropane fatty-acyl-phospholipid synthase-like methyltransferase
VTSDRGTAQLTTFYGEMSSLERVLAALTKEGVDVDHLRASDLYERDLDCQNLGAYEMLDVIATAVARHTPPKPIDTVLDVGCGMGGPGRFLADRFGCSVLGVDLVALRVEVAEALTDRTGLADRVSYRVADATQLPVDDAAVTQVWMLDVGIHVRDKHALFAELARALRPGGLLVMHDQTGPLPAAMRKVTREIPFIAPSLPQLIRQVEGAGLRTLSWQDSSAQVARHFVQIKARLEQRAARSGRSERRPRSDWFVAIADAYIATLTELGGRTGILIAERLATS